MSARCYSGVKRHSLPFHSMTVLLCISTLQASQINAKERHDVVPNVILILADDLAIGDLGGHNGKPTRTPNLDRLAAQSVRFDHAYSASCVCAPARAALLTGRYPHRTGVVSLNMNKYPRLTRLRRDEVTIADRMRDSGYVTGLVGKWHIGRGKDYHPLARGFDHFEGFDGSQVLSYFDYSLDLNGDVTPIDGKYLTEDLSARAIDFVRRHQARPFFLHLAHYAPHRPLEAPAGLVRQYQAQGFDESTATIYAMIEIMDRGIGALIEELATLDLLNNTIVIFASDNGPDPLTGTRFNHALRGTKYQIYEGGIRVPLMVSWPSVLQPSRRDQVVHFVDVLPTVLDLCGIDQPREHSIDGSSFADVLKDAAVDFVATRYWQWNRGEPNYTHNAAVRKGRFKLVRPFVTRGANVTDSKLPSALYDLAVDPTESRDLSHELPDRVSELELKLQAWSQAVERDRLRGNEMSSQP